MLRIFVMDALRLRRRGAAWLAPWLAIVLFALTAAGCGSLSFADLPEVPGVSGVPGVGVSGLGGGATAELQQACTDALKGAIAERGLTDPGQVNGLIDAIQDSNEGCDVGIWNPLATGDPGADACMQGLVRDQVTAGALGGGDGALFIQMQASDGTPDGEGCFMYHAKEGTWVNSALDHAREHMRKNRCKRAPGSMVSEPDPDCAP